MTNAIKDKKTSTKPIQAGANNRRTVTQMHVTHITIMTTRRNRMLLLALSALFATDCLLRSWKYSLEFQKAQFLSSSAAANGGDHNGDHLLPPGTERSRSNNDDKTKTKAVSASRVLTERQKRLAEREKRQARRAKIQASQKKKNNREEENSDGETTNADGEDHGDHDDNNEDNNSNNSSNNNNNHENKSNLENNHESNGNNNINDSEGPPAVADPAVRLRTLLEGTDRERCGGRPDHPQPLSTTLVLQTTADRLSHEHVSEICQRRWRTDPILLVAAVPHPSATAKNNKHRTDLFQSIETTLTDQTIAGNTTRLLVAKETTTTNNNNQQQSKQKHSTVACPHLRLVKISLSEEESRPESYPINRLRNIGLSLVKDTSHVLVTDIDMLPSQDLDRTIRDLLVQRSLSKRTNEALIIPAFEMQNDRERCTIHHGDETCPYPTNFHELDQCYEKGTCISYKSKQKVEDQSSTKPDAWIARSKSSSHQSKELECLDYPYDYTPYLVVPWCGSMEYAEKRTSIVEQSRRRLRRHRFGARKKNRERKVQEMTGKGLAEALQPKHLAPYFDERFTGYGKNKIAWNVLLHHAGYFKFIILGRGFLVHKMHKESPSKLLWKKEDAHYGHGIEKSEGQGQQEVVTLRDKMDYMYARYLEDLKFAYNDTKMLPTCADVQKIKKRQRKKITLASIDALFGLKAGTSEANIGIDEIDDDMDDTIGGGSDGDGKNAAIDVKKNTTETVKIDEKTGDKFESGWRRPRPQKDGSDTLDDTVRTIYNMHDDKYAQNSKCPSNLDENDIQATLVLQASLSRAWILKETCQRYQGPIVVTMVIFPDDDMKEIDAIIDNRKKDCPHMTFIPYKLDEMQATAEGYPINMLRNVGLDAVSTSHVITADVDFVPSDRLDEKIRKALKRQKLVRSLKYKNDDEAWEEEKLEALVVPAFQMLDRGLKCKDEESCRSHLQKNSSFIPQTFPEMQHCIKRKKCSVFHEARYREGHSSTRTKDWLKRQWYEDDGNSTELDTASNGEPREARVIPCIFSDGYEPYLVLRWCPTKTKSSNESSKDVTSKPLGPFFDERFAGYGLNKVSQVRHVQLMGYKMSVLPEGFLVHNPHPKSKSANLWENGKASGWERRLFLGRVYKFFQKELQKRYKRRKDRRIPQCPTRD